MDLSSHIFCLTENICCWWFTALLYHSNMSTLAVTFHGILVTMLLCYGLQVCDMYLHRNVPHSWGWRAEGAVFTHTVMCLCVCLRHSTSDQSSLVIPLCLSPCLHCCCFKETRKGLIVHWLLSTLTVHIDDGDLATRKNFRHLANSLYAKTENLLLKCRRFYWIV